MDSVFLDSSVLVSFLILVAAIAFISWCVHKSQRQLPPPAVAAKQEMVKALLEMNQDALKAEREMLQIALKSLKTTKIR